jgi:D-3-phosphoglycerate dehydrogenase
MKRRETSYPRGKIKVLLLEGISQTAADQFAEAGYTDIRRVPGALSEDELAAAIRGVHLLGIRSKTRITPKVVERADRLLGIGCFCIGTNQVNMTAAADAGIAVFNAPYSNTRSVAELVIGLCVMLIRRIPDKNAAAHRGVWLKEAQGSFELRGKTLGIVGYGNIGSQVSVMAEAMGMKIVYYDIVPKLPHGNAQRAKTLRELLQRSDIVTLHVPADATTRNMINEKTLAAMRLGALLINYSRGDVVDLPALKRVLDAGGLAGAAIDVFPTEPEKHGDEFSTVLQNLPNVILTPHIGGSTEEAQAHIGLDVAAKLLNFLEQGLTTGSHTVPEVGLPPQDKAHRILHIHRNMPGVLGEINSRLSDLNINILGQYLRTNAEIGYVILDVDKKLSRAAADSLKTVKGTIRARLLY